MAIDLQQLVLDFPLDPICSFDNLVEGEGNRLAVALVKAMADMGATSLTLTGEAGTGKTHLLQAAVQQWRQRVGEEGAIYLGTARLGEQLQESGEEDLTRFLGRHGGYRMVAVDDLEKMADFPALQEGLLYLFNEMRASGGRMLFASRGYPGGMGWMRSDLRSRILWGQVAAIDPPGDDELGAILEKMVADRQVVVDPTLLKFLQLRLPRGVMEYAAALDRLDTAGQSLKRPLTVPLAKEVLGL